ncbi:Outer membrane efflux protein [Gimesia chilikensis]|uniref:Outer membrane efflux protein n=1 Tax=Gimesia chilikensis TaxID=2605989 RepID=A0A517WJR3_9PLAN|nr:TolC family protein [Gimesia chilikensis]QDU05497.1 Outer membrane efflux protein [Gimesia chilikensis]
MLRVWIILLAVLSEGCAVSRQKMTRSESDPEPSVVRIEPTVDTAAEPRSSAAAPVVFPEKVDVVLQESQADPGKTPVQQVSSESTLEEEPASEEAGPAEFIAAPHLPPVPGQDFTPSPQGLVLEVVINSVYASYPLLEAALYSREVASGQQLQRMGEFDHKLKAGSENQPMGYYQTYRQHVGLIKPLYQGGEAFAGYRIGRGSFEPWYLGRQTNDGGELKAGFSVPLAKNRDIDQRRAALWRATYGVDAVEPEIQAQLIDFVQQGSYAYWEWVAAGAKLVIADRILNLAEERTERIRSQVENGLLDPPELTDNLRLVAERRGKRALAERKLQQTAVKLSLFYRDANGDPVIPGPEQVPRFPKLEQIDDTQVALDASRALDQRPEIYSLDLLQRQLDIDYSEAENECLPAVDLLMAGSQDMGYPSSYRNYKGPFELDAHVLVEVPLERRKARGKMQSVGGKISQLNAKRKLTEEKIIAEVESAYAGLIGAYKQAQQAEQAVGYAEDLARRERRNFEEGLSDLLKVTLREQYAFESAEKAVDAKLLYFKEKADYRASLAEDQL